MTDHGSEYGRLLAERDRLVAAGADPAELETPIPPTGPQDYARLERYVAAPESVRPTRPSPTQAPPDLPRFRLLTWALIVALMVVVAVLIANRGAA
jgi:hypothetical protein